MDSDLPTIAIVDDASEVRLLIKTRIRLSGRLAVVGEGSDGAEAVALAERHQPRLMLLDVSMPGMDGLGALPKILAASPSTRVVLYSGFEEQGLIEKAEQLGAAAFIQKSTPVDSLVDKLTAVLGERGGATGRAAHTSAEEPVAVDVRMGPPTPDQRVLDEHLERFREVFDEAAIGMATMTLTGHLVRVNRALAALVLRSPEELLGLFYGDLTDGQDEAVALAMDKVVKHSVDVAHLEHGVTGASDARQVRATLAPVRDSGGRALYLFLQVQDVTTERAAAEELRRSEERFRLLVAAVQDYAIFMLSPEGVITSWNNGAQRSNGYTEEEIVGSHFRVFYPPEQQQARHPEHELELALRDGSYTEDGWRVRKDGSRFWANVVITPVFDPTGRHLGFAKVTRDITERRATEEALRQSEERFRLLVETVQDYAIFMLSPEGVIASWNNGARRIKGYTAEEIIGSHFRVFYPPELQEARHPEHELEVAIQEGHYEEEGWRIRKDGSRFWANVVITAVFNASGELIGFTKVTRDTTDRRRLEQEREEAVQTLASTNAELESLNEKLQQAAQDQTQFLAVTAHELRTPIVVLGGSAETLSRHWTALTDEERGELLDGMASSTNRLKRLLGDLLTASRLEANKLEIHSEPVSVSDVVADATASVRRRGIDAEILVDVPTDIVVTADRDRLAQALDNLLSNALLHGDPPIRVSAVHDSDRVFIRVSDQGPGVSEAVRPRLFQRFATGRSKGGTGLGLFIVRELARAHGGDAQYEPASAGTTAGAFVISLPLRRHQPQGL
jgi:PAS domain S-box-containing protein